MPASPRGGRAPRRVLLLVLAALLPAGLAGAPAPARAQEAPAAGGDRSAQDRLAERARWRPEAERRNKRGNELYDQGRFDLALSMYQAAYDLYPDPRYLFNVGLAREKMFDFEECAVAFARFLDESDRTAQDVRRQAEGRRAACRERTVVAVRVTSAPSNAGIWIGEGETRTLRGRTPQEIGLPPGTYLVTAELQGYSSQSQPITIEPGSRPQVDFVLEKLSTLRVEADPAGARVKIGDLPWEGAPVTREILPGRHEVRVEKDGYLPATREVTVAPGLEVSLVLSLRARPRIRSLTIRADVPAEGAQVRIDGVPAGRAPASRQIRPGPHRVEVAAAGHLPFVDDITVPDDRDLGLRVRLTPERTQRNRTVFWGLAGGAGAAATVGGIYGGLALSDQAAFKRDPSVPLRDRGDARARTADAWFGGAVVLGLGAAAWHVFTRPRPSSAVLEF
jgi:hypothetical protein